MIPKISVVLNFIVKSDSNSVDIDVFFSDLISSEYINSFTLNKGKGCWFLMTPYENNYEIDDQLCSILNFLETKQSLINTKKECFSDIVIRFCVYACDTIPSLFFGAKEIERLHSLNLGISVDIDIVLTEENERD